MNNIDNVLINIAYALDKGYYYNGDRFTCISFFCKIPFIECEENFYVELEKYLRLRFGIDNYVYKNIINYINKINVKKIEFIDDTLYELDEFVFENTLVNNELRKKIIKYMELKKYPKILIIYSLILYDIAYGYEDIDTILNKEDKKKNFKLIKGGKNK